MKKQKLLLIILTSLFITNSSYADYAVKGDYSCGNVIKYDKENNSVARKIIVSWFNGFASGANWKSGNTDVDTFSDANSIYYSVVKFCKENPLKYSADATEFLYLELNN
jgi:hypothetical protein